MSRLSHNGDFVAVVCTGSRSVYYISAELVFIEGRLWGGVRKNADLGLDHSSWE